MSSNRMDKDCECEANQFLKRYKERLEIYLADVQNLQEEGISERSYVHDLEVIPEEISEHDIDLDAIPEELTEHDKSLIDRTSLRKSSYGEGIEKTIKSMPELRQISKEKSIPVQKEPIPAIVITKPSDEDQIISRRSSKQASQKSLDQRSISKRRSSSSKQTSSKTSITGQTQSPRDLSKLSKLLSQQSMITNKQSTFVEIPVKETVQTIVETSPKEEETLAESIESSSINTEKMLELNLKTYPRKTIQDDEFVQYKRYIDERLKYLYGDGSRKQYGEDICKPKKELMAVKVLYKSTLYSSSSTSGEQMQPPEIVEIEEPWMSESERKAILYLRSHRIFDFFHFMGSHLVAESPYNPIDFLIRLLDKCLHSRVGLCEPPLLFDKKHVESLYDAMDPMKTGFIDMDQYRTGMYTLRIKDYDDEPPTKDNLVDRNTFIEEAYRRLLEDLIDMINCSIMLPRRVTPAYSSTVSFSAE